MNQPAYQHLARWYEQLMEVDYDHWAAYIHQLIDSNPAETKILDLGCGTAVLSRKLADLGYSVMGVDASSAMLNVAWQNNDHHHLPLIQQDITELELDREFDVIISTCDVFNYLTTDAALLQVLQRVRNHLKPGGRLLFDVSSAYKLAEFLGNHRDNYVADDLCYIWNNDWDDSQHLLTLGLVLFAQNEQGLYERFEEEHEQRGWLISEIKALVEQAGMQVEHVFDAFTTDPVKDTSERIQWIVRPI